MLTELDYSHNGVALKGRLATPAGPGPHPGVLVMYSARGFTRQVLDRTTQLAEAGYVALATDMYGVDPDPANLIEDTSRLLAELHDAPNLLRGRVLAGFETLARQPQVDVGRIGAIGFCFGGECVLDLARSGADVRAVVSFHGVLTTRMPAQPDAVKARILALCGAKDPIAPPEHRAALQTELAAANADWQMTVYSEACHAFTDPEIEKVLDSPGIKYDPFIDRLSWAQATTFLDACLG